MIRKSFLVGLVLASSVQANVWGQCCGSQSSSGGATSFISADCPGQVPKANWEYQITCSASGHAHTRMLEARGACKAANAFGCYFTCDPILEGPATSVISGLGHLWHASALNTSARETGDGGFLCVGCACYTWECDAHLGQDATVLCPCESCGSGTGGSGGNTSDPGCRNQGGQAGAEDNCAEGTPIIVSARGNGIGLTNAAQGVHFDLDSDGRPERLAWTRANGDDAFLALDRNGNGMIDDGSELFGDYTPQPPSDMRNGFEALAVFDQPEQGGDGDGWISARDRVFAHLLFWTDSNHDGISQPFELRPVPQSQVQRFGLDYRETPRTDRYGNQFRYIGVVYLKNRVGQNLRRRFAVDVILVVDPDSLP